MTTPLEGKEIELEPAAADVSAEVQPGAETTAAASAGAPTVTELESSRPITGDESIGTAEPAAADAKKSRPLQALIDLLHDLAIAVVVCVLLITYVVQAFKVQGTSMSPELGDGERILVNKFLYHFGDIHRGDVVVFWYPEDPGLSFIKRVVGLPGETVEIREGLVYVDGRPMEEAYVSDQNADRRNYPATAIRPGHYFVLGDNRKGSNDSRSWGFVPERYIYGKAFLRLWPPAHFGAVE